MQSKCREYVRRSDHRTGVRLLMAAVLGAWPLASRATISLTAGPGGTGTVINTLLGADRFYNNGYFGQGAVVANVEGGYVWDGHETTSFMDPSIAPDTYFANPLLTSAYPQLGSFDYHATAVGSIIAGRSPSTSLLAYQTGIAPYASLRSGAIATSFSGVDSNGNPSGTFDDTNASFTYAYAQAMGVVHSATTVVPLGSGIFQTNTFSQKADVVNSSWGFTDPTGSAQETQIIDALVYQNHTTFVAAAGNSGPGGNSVIGPASGFNKIAVAALAGDNTPTAYNTVASFSSRGLNDFYNPHPTGNQPSVIPAVRPSVDLAAPGDQLVAAYYGGATGSNSGGTDTTTANSGAYYLVSAAGTSFAAPMVAGGASLLAGYAHSNPTFGGGPSIAADGRVIKAILLNSADKTPGWDNGQQLGTDGVIRTAQGLDASVGAGRMNLSRAYDQYISGTVNAGNGGSGLRVQPTGWAMGNVAQGAPNDYVVDNITAGQTLTATLTWFIHGTYNDNAPTDSTLTGDAAVGAYGGSATTSRFDNLELQVWLANQNGTQTEIADSNALYNNVQHLSLLAPFDGTYDYRVIWEGRVYDTSSNPSDTPNSEDYALAWSNADVPEPTAILLVPGGMLLLRRRRRGRKC